MDSSSSLSPRVVVLLIIAIMAFFVWAEVRARQQGRETSSMRYEESWFFAREAPPQTRLAFTPSELQNGSAAPTTTPFIDAFQVSIVAVLPDHAQAIEAGNEVRELLQALTDFYAQPAQQPQHKELLTQAGVLPLSVIEEDFFTKRGIQPERIGIGWPGPQSTVTNSIQIIGPLLIVRGLKENMQDERRNPLESLLKKRTKEVLLENDRIWGGAIVTDLTCQTATAAKASELAQTLQMYGVTPYYYYLRPPWQPPALSPAEVNARRTYSYIVERMEELANNKAFYRLETAIYQYYQFDDPRLEQARNRIRDHIRQAQLKLLDELQQDPTLDATIVAQYRKGLQARWREVELEGMAFGRRMGQVPLVLDYETNQPTPGDDALETSAFMDAIHAKQNLLNLGYMTFDRFANGFPALIHYLTAEGCTNFAFALTDFDQVRGD